MSNKTTTRIQIETHKVTIVRRGGLSDRFATKQIRDIDTETRDHSEPEEAVLETDIRHVIGVPDCES